MTKSTTTSASSLRWLMTGVVILVLGGGAWSSGMLKSSWLGSLLGADQEKKDHSLVIEQAVRGPFLLSLSVQGSIDSRKNATLISNVEGGTTILSIVPEGTQVKEGDVVCELDSSALVDLEKQQQITVTSASALLEQARTTLEVTKNQNLSDIAAAKLARDLAILDLEKFKDGEFPQQEKLLSGNVALADEELLRQQENYEFVADQVKKGYSTQNNLEAARIAVKQAQLKLEGAKEELKVLEQYTYKRTIAELEAAARELGNELERVKLKADSAEAAAAKDVEAKELTFRIEKEKQAKLQAQIAACTLKAPQAGEVVYANLSSNRRSSEQVNIEEGATVRQYQEIINLPDVTQMKVDCRIHESLIGFARKGLKTRIRVDAYPEEIFNGEISSVASVSSTGSWPNTDLREYQSEIYLTDDVDKVRRLRPGLTAQVEILVDNRDNVLQVPIQAVAAVGDRKVAWVLENNKPARRDVKMGQTNQSHIEILDGVEEGEWVILNPKTRFASEIADLEAEIAAQRAKETAELGPAAAEEGTPAPEGPGGGGPEGRGPNGAGGEPRGQGGGGPRGPGGAGGNPQAFFERMDTNGDGKLTPDEVPERMKDRFSTIDKNGDGSITPEEMAASRPPGGGGGGFGGGGRGGAGPDGGGRGGGRPGGGAGRE